MKIFLFYFEMAIKITGSAQNYRVCRVSGNTPIFLGLTEIAIRQIEYRVHMVNLSRRGGCGGSVVERRTPERKVQGPNPTCSVIDQDTLSSPKYW